MESDEGVLTTTEAWGAGIWAGFYGVLLSSWGGALFVVGGLLIDHFLCIAFGVWEMWTTAFCDFR